MYLLSVVIILELFAAKSLGQLKAGGSRTVHYTKSTLDIKYRIQYYCCSGWARSGDQCPRPICNPGCQNGRCTNPNVCSCNAGFVGNLCQTDVNECNLNPCDQICTNLPVTYSCSCRSGYVKTVPTDPKSKTCKNVDECKTSPCKCALNTHDCVASCVDSDGSFSCSCNSGFQLPSSAGLCVDINECAAASTNICQQKCLNRPGNYSCTCNSGYLLMEIKRSCKVQCRAGWYSDSGGKCKKCMRGYYQPLQGSKHCLPRDDSGKTDEKGSLSKKDCKTDDKSKSSSTLQIALIASLVPLVIICIAVAVYLWRKKKRVDTPCKETEKFPPAFQNLAYSDNEVTEACQA